MDNIIKQVEDDVRDLLLDQVRDVIQGANEDIQGFAQQIAKNLTYALTVRDATLQSALLEEIGQQAVLLATKQRLQINKQGWATIDKVINLMTNMSAIIMQRLIIPSP